MSKIVHARFLRNSALKGVEICQVTQSDHVFPKHFHEDFYAFSFMEEGGSYWTEKEKKNSLVAPGNIALIPPGLVHSGSPLKKNTATYKMVYIDNSLMQTMVNQIKESQENFPEFSRIVLSDPALTPSLNQLYEGILHSHHALELESLLYDFLGRLLKEYDITGYHPLSVGRDQERMNRAREFLSANLSHKITLAQVADQIGLSHYHFLRTFKMAWGLSPHAFRTQRRVDMAKNLILRGVSLSQVAMDTGFSDQAHLTHKFKEYTGTTPRQYHS